MPQDVTPSLMFLKMGEFDARNMLN